MSMKRIHGPVLGVLSLGLVSFALAAARWVPYENPALGFSVKVPNNWRLKVTPKAVGFTGPGEESSRPAFGVLRSTVVDFTIDQAVAKEYKQKHKPSNWKQIPTTLAGARAIKIVTGVASNKILEYYVETPGGYYLLQCVAPEALWQQFNDTFATVLRTFRFLQ